MRTEKVYWLQNKNGEIVQFTSQIEFCLKYNLHRGNISMVLSGLRKSHKGWKLAASGGTPST